jgi:alkylation response protein AidB-like acyl-CoA dehydrogenase
VFGMAMPRAWGGPELDPLTQFRVIEALAMADGSVGWCAMIGSRRWLHHQNKGGPRRGGDK